MSPRWRRAEKPVVLAATVALVVGPTAGIVLGDAGPGSLLRHLYLLPTILAALRFGRIGGFATAAAVILLNAPLLLRAIERWGLAAGSIDGGITFAVLVGIGGVAGRLVDRGRRQRERYETVLALQRSLGAGTPLCEGIRRGNRALEKLLRADTVELLVRREDGAYVGEGGVQELKPGRAGATVAETTPGLSLAAVAGLSRPGRPERAIVVRLVAGARTIGLAGAMRAADFSRDDRAALEALGVQIVLALDHARVGSELEAKVAAATQELRELNRAKTEFVSIASHELRTPLTSLRGFSELLLARRYAEDDARKFVSVIHSEAARLGRLLDNLLDVARIERGQHLELRPLPVDVRQLLHGCADLFRAQSDRRISVTIGDDAPDAFADRDAVDRILTNLVANALKYSPPTSEVRLAAAKGEDGQVEIAVEDDGPGIPERDRPHVFDRYYRAARPGSGVRGLGLGLALVKALVEASGGSVTVTSGRGIGSRFVVALPAVPAASATLDPGSRP